MPFERVLGQDQPVEILKKSIEKKTVSHAYLFYGPEGVGKKLAAIELAKALNCLGRGNACGGCESCRKIDQRIHPDFFLVEPEKKTPTSREAVIRIERIRELQKKLIYMPYEGRTKVALIDGAEWMNAQASNTLLKTLEEPPRATILILTVVNPFQLLPTLVSRCQGIRFGRLSSEIILKVLEKELEDNEDIAVLKLRAERAEGSISRALALQEERVEAGEQRENLLDLIAGVSFDRMDAVFKWSKTWARRTGTLQPLLDELLGLLRDLAVLKVRGPSHLHNPDLLRQMRPVAQIKSLPALLDMFDAVRETKRLLAGNANAQLALETLLIKFSDTQGRPQ
ncbi:MAG: DNA polymerase III subunit delta' [Nitrospinaceae bacterium]|jgi:DNA polymerase-3 subunit delta'|nr:MAG: DNA polymerase III subunit delta' [Nitrospinaceae bacterium]